MHHLHQEGAFMLGKVHASCEFFLPSPKWALPSARAASDAANVLLICRVREGTLLIASNWIAAGQRTARCTVKLS